MFNHHSIIPWGSFQGSGSFRGRDHFGGCTEQRLDLKRFRSSFIGFSLPRYVLRAKKTRIYFLVLSACHVYLPQELIGSLDCSITLIDWSNCSLLIFLTGAIESRSVYHVVRSQPFYHLVSKPSINAY